MYPYAPLQYVCRKTNNIDMVRAMTDHNLPAWNQLNKLDVKVDDIVFDEGWNLEDILLQLEQWLTDGNNMFDIAYDIILMTDDIRKIVNTYIYRDSPSDAIHQVLVRTGYGNIPIKAIDAYRKYFWRWEYLTTEEKDSFLNKLYKSEGEIYQKALTMPDYQLALELQTIPDIKVEDFLNLVLGYGMTHLRNMFFKAPRSPGSAVYPALKAAELALKLKELEDADKDKEDLITLLGLHIKYEKGEEFPDVNLLDNAPDSEIVDIDSLKGEEDGNSENSN